jgi:hypothetical protein
VAVAVAVSVAVSVFAVADLPVAILDLEEAEEDWVEQEGL